jgi:hypothetical protein
MEINTVIFDLGGVLIDWNPRMFIVRFLKRKKR